MSKVLEILAKRLKQRLKELDWTQEDFAKALNTTHPAVNPYFNAKRSAGIDKIEEFANVLNVSPAWLLSEGEGPIREVRAPVPSSEELAAMVIGKMLPNGERKRLAQFILSCEEEELATVIDVLSPIADDAGKLKRSSL